MQFTKQHFRICNCYGCENELLTLKEVKDGICKQHMDRVSDEENFVGICWECMNITIVDSRIWDDRHKMHIIPSKYIFSKGCKRCTGDEETNIDWMTILGESVADEITGVKNRKDLSNVAVAEITNQPNGLKFVSYSSSQANGE
jgi:hypothetical protein